MEREVRIDLEFLAELERFNEIVRVYRSDEAERVAAGTVAQVDEEERS